jgi:hypothetical protein
LLKILSSANMSERQTGGELCAEIGPESHLMFVSFMKGLWHYQEDDYLGKILWI